MSRHEGQVGALEEVSCRALTKARPTIGERRSLFSNM